MQENGLLRKLRLISKFITSQTGLQTITIQILPDISIDIRNQKIKFSQPIKYNVRKFFLEKLCT